MHGDPPKLEMPSAETPEATRQFHLSTALAAMVPVAAAFSLARYLELDGMVRQYVQGFRGAPFSAAINLAMYVLLACVAARFFRRQILEADLAWPTNGAFFGTVYGGALFGMTLCCCVSSWIHPFFCFFALLLCGVIGAGWAAVPAVLCRALIEPLDDGLNSSWRSAGIGLFVGAAAGYGSSILILLVSPWIFLVYGVIPASFGAVFGARGAFLQAVTHGRRHQMARETLDRLKRIGDELPAKEGFRRRQNAERWSPGTDG